MVEGYYARIENRDGEDWLVIGSEAGYNDIKISALDKDTLLSFACGLIVPLTDYEDITDIMEKLGLFQEPDME